MWILLASIVLIALCIYLATRTYRRVRIDFGNNPQQAFNRVQNNDKDQTTIFLDVYKSEMQAISDHAALKGQTVNAYILRAVRQRMKRDDNDTPDD
jgi:hypothetical protein